MKKLKSFLSVSLLAFAFVAAVSLPAPAQTLGEPNPAVPEFSVTNAPIVASPVLDAFNFLSTPTSNWMFATYGIFTKGEGEGVGVGALYKVSDTFGAVLRLDRIGNDTYMPSGNFQVQVPVTLMGRVTIVPFAFTGIATPLNDSGNHDGVIGIFGIGSAIRVPESIKSKSRFIPEAVVYDYEKWTSYQGAQHRVGFLWKF